MIYNIKENKFTLLYDSNKNILNSQLILENENIKFTYNIISNIGKGSVSDVYLIELNKKHYVLKIGLDNSNYMIDELETILHIFYKNKISHKCMPIYYGNIDNIDKNCIIYPYFGKYNLENIKLFNLSYREKINIFMSIEQQLSSLINCIHCDIKPENIILDDIYNIPTIIDFGLIKNINDNDITSTSYITSPESILSKHTSLIDNNETIIYKKHDYYGLFFVILTLLLNTNFWNIFYKYLINIKINKDDMSNEYLYVYCWYKFYYNSISEIEIVSLQKLIMFIENKYSDINQIKFLNFYNFYDRYIKINNNNIKIFLYYLIHFDYTKRKLLLNYL